MFAAAAVVVACCLCPALCVARARHPETGSVREAQALTVVSVTVVVFAALTVAVSAVVVSAVAVF